MNPPPSRRGSRFIRKTPVPAPESEAVPPINIDLVDAMHRAERAEAEVARLTQQLRQKEEILSEARAALRSAKVALQEHLRSRAADG